MILETVGIGRKAEDRWLLENVSLSVDSGQRLALVGPSGSGKTLLLRALALLDPVDAGEIRWNGKSVAANEVPRYRSRVIYLHQRPALLEGTVEDNLRLPYSLRAHHDKQFNRQRIVALLKSLGRTDAFLSKQQRDLSGGEAQLCSLLRAVQLDPDVLLLDEPTAALDAEAAGTVESLVANWLDQQPKGRATVWVTHGHEQAERVSQSVMHLRDGHLNETG